MRKKDRVEIDLQKKYLLSLKKDIHNKKKFDYSGDIRLENVSYTYSPKSPFEFRALDNANLLINQGKITCIIGTTGSGKSTLIQLTNGLLISETGRIVIGDYQIPAFTKKVYDVENLRRQIGLVFQFPEYQIFQETVEKDIAFGPIHLGENKTEVYNRIPDLMRLVDLPIGLRTRSPFELSGGQKRRVAIAGILAMNGSTLVLDEPTGGLDPQGEEDFMNLFLKLNQTQGRRIIMVTHNMDQVLRIADYVVVMNEGKVIDKGTPSEIFANHQLLKKINIEPPKVYQLIYKMKNKGVDLTGYDIRNIGDFVKYFLELKPKPKPAVPKSPVNPGRGSKNPTSKKTSSLKKKNEEKK